MKKLIISIAFSMALAACSNNPVKRSITPQGNVTFDGDRKSYEIYKTEESRKSCYAAIIEISANKLKQSESFSQMVMQFMSNTTDDMVRMMGLMMVQNNQMMQLLITAIGGQEKAPLSCNQMGIYEYKINRNGQILGFAKDLTGKLVTVAKWGIGQSVLKDITGKLSRPSIQGGDGSTNVLGDNNNVDQRQQIAPEAIDESCELEGGGLGVAGDSGICRPIEEEGGEEEPTPEEPTIDEPEVEEPAE